MLTIVKFIASFVFAISIVISDLKTYKIKNKAVLAAIVTGLFLNILDGSIASSFYGLIFPLILFPLYVLRMLGAGDVKALCAIGAIVGFHDSVKNLVFTFIVGGIIGIVFLVINKNGVARFKRIWCYLKSCFMMGRIEKYDFGREEKGYFRFSYAIFGGLIVTTVNYWLHLL